jgi:hypothetical protein
MIYHLPKSPKLTDVHEDLLQQQTILEGKPGTILFDFNTLLNFIGAEGILVTGTHLLPMKQLSDLNARLTHPIQHGLSRPQQKSYPHINGLYLLVRASGLTQIEQQRNKPRLVIDQEVFPSWANLNVTERYFTLLESWLLRGRSEIVGERGGPFWHDAPIIRCLDFFHRLPAEGVDVKNDDEFRYYPSYHNLALLELFGLISIQRGPVVAGQGWQITHISPPRWVRPFWPYWQITWKPIRTTFSIIMSVLQRFPSASFRNCSSFIFLSGKTTCGFQKMRR